MKMHKSISLIAVGVISLFAMAGCGPSYVAVSDHYDIPPWGPPYYSPVRYYYLPDIEVYYDLSDQEFVYLDNGEWLFSPALPPMVSEYDLYGGFVISLDINVFQPWLHHQYYVSHYPRYYYRSVYHDWDISTLRGFNENNKRPIVWRQVDRDRIRDMRKSGNEVKRPAPTRLPQKSNYYGRDIGRPVKVKPQMREKAPAIPKSRPQTGTTPARPPKKG